MYVAHKEFFGINHVFRILSLKFIPRKILPQDVEPIKVEILNKKE